MPLNMNSTKLNFLQAKTSKPLSSQKERVGEKRKAKPPQASSIEEPQVVSTPAKKGRPLESLKSAARTPPKSPAKSPSGAPILSPSEPAPVKSPWSRSEEPEDDDSRKRPPEESPQTDDTVMFTLCLIALLG